MSRLKHRRTTFLEWWNDWSKKISFCISKNNDIRVTITIGITVLVAWNTFSQLDSHNHNCSVTYSHVHFTHKPLQISSAHHALSELLSDSRSKSLRKCRFHAVWSTIKIRADTRHGCLSLPHHCIHCADGMSSQPSNQAKQSMSDKRNEWVWLDSFDCRVREVMALLRAHLLTCLSVSEEFAAVESL